MAHKKARPRPETVGTPIRSASASSGSAASWSTPARSSSGSAVPTSTQAKVLAAAGTTRCSRWSRACSALGVAVESSM